MNTRGGFFHYWLIEPLTWIIFVIFQPARFLREFTLEGSRFTRQVLPLLRLVVPLLLVNYSCVLLVYLFLLPFNLLSHANPLIVFLGSAGGIAGGIAIAIAADISSDSSGIAVDIAFGIVFGIVFGIGGGIAVDIAGGITFGIVGNIVVSIVGGIVVGITSGTVDGIVGNIVVSIIGGIFFGIVSGIAGSIMGGIIFGIVGGIAFGIAFGIAYFIGHYRLPLYLISGSSILMAYIHSLHNPSKTLHSLQRSALHWDERVYLPLPYLKTMLLMAYHEQPVQTLDEIKYIASERPLQLHAARAAALEIVMRDLEERKSIQEIAEATQRIDNILPKEAKLMDSRWARSLALLADASQDALQSTTPIGLKSRVRATEKMMNNLHKVSPNVAFRDQSLNQRLKRVIEVWMTTAEQQRESLRHMAQELGRIDNPYKPGQVLQPDDSLFVGRRDLAEQLENELAKGSGRPTLLLNGERRMGKSSALLQLPHLLGSSYISAFYNLQDPGIYASTPILLGTIAQGIHTQLKTRGFPIKALSFSELQEYRQRINHAFAYRLFGSWLKDVEMLLEQEDKTLLLAFDEFEKLEEAGQSEYLNLSLLLDWFRSIVQFHPRIALLFSGVRTLDEMGKKTGMNWSSYLINVQVLKVTFLKEHEAYKLITKPVDDYPSEEIFGKGVVDKIMKETGRHPFLIQAICSAMIDNLNVEKREQAELADVDSAIEQILENWVGYFSDLWTRTDDNQRACLLALNALQSATAEAIEQKSGLDKMTARRTLQLLCKRDLIVCDNERNYALAAPIFSKWVENSQYL